MKNIVLALTIVALPAFAGSEVETEWIFVLTAHNAKGALVAVDTEGPFATKSECEGVGLVITKRVYKVIGTFQPEVKSGLEWDRLTTSCEEVKRPFSSNTY